MVVVGADVHKATHTFVAVDEVGKQVGQLTVAATPEGSPQGVGVGAHGSSRMSWSGRSRTVGTCPRGWSGTCSRRGSRWCGCRRR